MENRFAVGKGQERRKKVRLGAYCWQMQTITFRIDKQEGLNV